MNQAPETKRRQWIPLGTACRILDVNQATLRQWADNGLLRAYRTPGGHRRFSSDDVYALVERAARLPEASAPRQLDAATLRRIRRRLHSAKVSGQRWYETIDEDTRTRLRLFGRRLLTLASEYLSQRRRRPEVLAEARTVGEEYGREMAQRHVPLSDVIQAFIFFRNTLLDAAQETFPGSGARGEQVGQSFEQMLHLADEVLLALTHAFESWLGDRVPAA